MKDLERGQERVDASHEALEEDDLGETNGHCLEVAREGVEIVEVLELHGGAEVEREIFEIGAPVGELVEHMRRDELDGQLDVLEMRVEAVRYQVGEVLHVAYVNRVLVVGPQLESAPQFRVLRQRAPELAHESALDDLVMVEEREYV